MEPNLPLPHLNPNPQDEKTSISSKLWTKDFVFVCIMNLFIFGAFQMLQPTMPLYIRQLGGSDLLAGLSTSAFALSAIFARPFVGWALDHKGRRGITMGGMFFFACVSLLYNFTSVIGVILLLRMLHGLAFGISSSASGTAASDIVPRERFAQGISFFGVTSNIAMAAAPAVGLWLINDYSFNHLFFGSFFLAMVAFALTSKMNYPKLDAVTKQPKTKLWDLINKKSIPSSIVMMWCAITYAAISTFVAIYAQTKNINAGIFFAVMAASAAISRVAISSVVDRQGGNLVLYWGLALFVGAPIFLVFANTELFFAISALFFGVGFGFIMPSLQTIAVRSASTNTRGAATSTFYLAFDLGMVLGGVISGWLAGIIGFEGMFMVMIFPVIIAAITFKKLCDKKPVLQSY